MDIRWYGQPRIKNPLTDAHNIVEQIRSGSYFWHWFFAVRANKNYMKKLLYSLTLTGLLFSACNNDDDDNNGGALNQTDRDFIMMASYGNNAEISAGQMASMKGMNLAVREYGEHMREDHIPAKTELEAIADDLDVNTPDGLDSAHQALALQLDAATGATFDSLYINSQIVDHQAMINLMQNELQNGSNTRVKNYAQKYLPAIQMHLQKADSVKQTL